MSPTDILALATGCTLVSLGFGAALCAIANGLKRERCKIDFNHGEAN
jgi:hypothetical protein